MLRLAEGAICGIFAGAVTGIAARFAMRLVADGLPDTTSRLPTFTPEGTMAVLVLAMLVGAPLGAIYAFARNGLRGSAVVRGTAFGTILLGIFGPLFFYGNPAEFGVLQTHLVRVSLFAALFLIFGLTVGIASPSAKRLAGWLPMPARAFFALVAVGGGAFLAGGTIGFAGEVARTYGDASLRLVLPWFVLAVVFTVAIRSRRASVVSYRDGRSHSSP